MTSRTSLLEVSRDAEPANNLACVLALARYAHGDTSIYHQKNTELKRRGDCKENVERFLRFLRDCGLELSEFSVIYLRREYTDYELDPRLAVDKGALRNEERALVVRQLFLGRFRFHRMLLNYHYTLMHHSRRVYDLSARYDLLGVDFQTYFESLFRIELSKGRQALLEKIDLLTYPASSYLASIEQPEKVRYAESHRHQIEAFLHG